MNRGRRLWETLVWRLTSVRIRTKILGMAVLLVVAMGGAASWLVRAELRGRLERELELRAVAIARELAGRSEGAILTERRFELYELIRAAAAANPDIRYVFVTDARGRVLVHSFESAVPPDLLRIRRDPPGDAGGPLLLASEEGVLTDVAVPILDGRAGVVRLGLSHRRLHALVEDATWRVAGVTALVLAAALGVALFLTSRLTQPILALVEVTRAVSRGDLSLRAAPRSEDEVGELTVAVNAMVESLARSRQELVRRVRELSALTATAVAAAAGRSAGEVVREALDRVLRAMDARAGWVFLAADGDDRLELLTWAGVPPGFVEAEQACERGRCVCREVMRSGRTVIAPDLATRCGRASARLLGAAGVGCHASVPVVARERVLGVLNIACEPSRRFSPEEVTLLESVGRQVGLAVENLRLWEDLRRKEARRGEFLSQVLAAQEAERKRVARELHDEVGQLLTVVLVRLRRLQDLPALPPEIAPLLAELRDLVQRLFDEIHRIAVELRPDVLDHLGLVGAIESVLADFGRRTGLKTDFEISGLDGAAISSDVEIAVYRIVQEALSNVARHARATRVAVALERRGETLVALVEDDGCGFVVDEPPSEGTAVPSRLGIFGMRERVALVHGRLAIESQPGQGTTVFVEVPLGAQA